MRAEITYNGGKSCTMKSTRFEEGRMRIVTDPDIIKHCRQTDGFAVHMLEDAPPKKKVMPVETAPSKAPIKKRPSKDDE